jgi:hypothetical protein
VLGPTQRETIIKALNEDAEKLIAEYGPNAERINPQLVRLRREMAECNQLYKELAVKLQREPALGTSQGFVDTLGKTRVELEGLEKEISTRIQEPLSQDLKHFGSVLVAQKVLRIFLYNKNFKIVIF